MELCTVQAQNPPVDCCNCEGTGLVTASLLPVYDSNLLSSLSLVFVTCPTMTVGEKAEHSCHRCTVHAVQQCTIHNEQLVTNQRCVWEPCIVLATPLPCCRMRRKPSLESWGKLPAQPHTTLPDMFEHPCSPSLGSSLYEWPLQPELNSWSLPDGL
jgi:hypothetical protein